MSKKDKDPKVKNLKTASTLSKRLAAEKEKPFTASKARNLADQMEANRLKFLKTRESPIFRDAGNGILTKKEIPYFPEAINPERLKLFPEINRIQSVGDRIYIEVETARQLQSTIATNAHDNGGTLNYLSTNRGIVLSISKSIQGKIKEEDGVAINVGDTVYFKGVDMSGNVIGPGNKPMPNKYADIYQARTTKDRPYNDPAIRGETAVIRKDNIVAVVDQKHYSEMPESFKTNDKSGTKDTV